MASSTAYISILSTRAQKEIIQAWEWYEERQQTLGDRFIKEVINKLRLIEQILKNMQPAINLTKKHRLTFFLFLSSTE